MAGDKDKREDPGAEQGSAFGDQKRNLMTIAVVGGLMLVEGVGLFMAVKFLSPGPRVSAGGEDGGAGAGGPDWIPTQSEISITDLVAFNSREGRPVVYQMSVFAYVDGNHATKIKEMIDARRNTIDDRLSKVVRASDPKYLNEPGLETLKRQFKKELSQILGEEFEIKEILFPEFSKSRAD